MDIEKRFKENTAEAEKIARRLLCNCWYCYHGCEEDCECGFHICSVCDCCEVHCHCDYDEQGSPISVV